MIIYYDKYGKIDSISGSRIDAKENNGNLSSIESSFIFDDVDRGIIRLDHYSVVDEKVVKKTEADIDVIDQANKDDIEIAEGERLADLLKKAGYDIRKVES